MSRQPDPESKVLAEKFARLAQERGWNQEDFARHANLNRQTIHQILHPELCRRLRNATVSACAQALGFSVSDLRELPLDRLLARIKQGLPPEADEKLRRLYEQATQPQLLAWIDRNPDRAAQLSGEEMDEMLSLQGTGGPLTGMGVEHYVELLERKRKLMAKIHAIAGTEYLDMLEQLVDLMYQKIQPYADRV